MGGVFFGISKESSLPTIIVEGLCWFLGRVTTLGLSPAYRSHPLPLGEEFDACVDGEHLKRC